MCVWCVLRQKLLKHHQRHCRPKKKELTSKSPCRSSSRFRLAKKTVWSDTREKKKKKKKKKNIQRTSNPMDIGESPFPHFPTKRDFSSFFAFGKSAFQMAAPGEAAPSSPKTPTRSGSALKSSKISPGPRFLSKKEKKDSVSLLGSPAKKKEKESQKKEKEAEKKENDGDKKENSSQSSSWWSLPSLRRSLIVSVGTSSWGKGAIIANLPYETQSLLKAIVSSNSFSLSPLFVEMFPYLSFPNSVNHFCARNRSCHSNRKQYLQISL